MHDVVVVGAGPTGSYAARELARLGYEVLVLEEHPEVGEPVHCTGVVGVEVYRRFDLDRGCVQAHLSGARFVSPSGQSFRVAAEQPTALVVDRRQFDRTLARQAFADGASFLLGTRADGVTITERNALVHATCLGEPVSLSASLVILATGTDDTLIRRLGLSQKASPCMFGGQLFVQNRCLHEVEIHLSPSLAPGGFAWAVPANGHGCRVGLLACRQPRHRLRKFADALEARGAIHRNGAEMTCRTIPAGPRIPSYGDRILVVGDAAGQVKSTTSGGIYYGLLGADAAVRTAHRALRTGDLAAVQLAGYQHRWLERIGSEQRFGRVLRRLHAGLSDRDMEALFWLTRRTGIARLLGRLQFDWHTAGLLKLLCRDLLGLDTSGQREAATPSGN
ncbi:MAG: NAD(P)/FAD-dependent oxidoreductase [Armatimonadota bacterium]|nr:MAG: NAD(P)/FAD-dependent oxidoreductase [Armatimonadota bacterium]